MKLHRSFASLFSSGFVVLLCCSRIAFGEAAPCTLLTQSQVSSVMGVSVGAGSPIANTGCSWHATGPSKVMVTVSRQSEKMFAGAKSGSKTALSGIGDEAFFTGVENFASLWMRKGSAIILVRVYGLPVNDAQTKLTTLAKSVVSKL